MSTAPASRPHDTHDTHGPDALDAPECYEIRVRGRLDPRWSALLAGMTLTCADGYTVLRGPLVDQAALHGLLHQLRDLGMPLASLSQVEPGDQERLRIPRDRPTSRREQDTGNTPSAEY